MRMYFRQLFYNFSYLEMLNDTDLNRGKLGLKPTVSIILSIILIMSTSCNKNDEDDIQKLEALKQAYLWNLSTEKGLEYIYKLKHEASKLKNDRYIGTAYYFLARSYLTDSSKRDSVLLHWKRLRYIIEELAIKEVKLLQNRTLPII